MKYTSSMKCKNDTNTEYENDVFYASLFVIDNKVIGVMVI